VYELNYGFNSVCVSVYLCVGDMLPRMHQCLVPRCTLSRHSCRQLTRLALRRICVLTRRDKLSVCQSSITGRYLVT